MGDDYGGGFSAVEHLIKSGYKRIAHLGGAKHLSVSRDRYKGYRDALKNYGIAFEEDLVHFAGFHEQDGIIGMQYLLDLKNPPDAVFTINDPVAIGAYDEIKKRKLRIPQDIALVGFSNNPISSIVDPPLTTIDQPAFELGKTATKILLMQIKAKNEKKSFKSIKEVLETKLIIREST